METWTTIPDWDKYEISTYGRVRRVRYLDKQIRRDANGHPMYRYLSPARMSRGYSFVTLHDGARKKQEAVHRLMAIVFLNDGNPLPDDKCAGLKDPSKPNDLHLNNIVIKNKSEISKAASLKHHERYERIRQSIRELMQMPEFSKDINNDDVVLGFVRTRLNDDTITVKMVRMCKRQLGISKRPKYEYNGERLTLRDFAAKYNIGYHTLVRRLAIKWTLEEALSTPVRIKNDNRKGS